MDKVTFRAQETYPEMQPCRLNRHDLQIICPLYTGTFSELSAILQYNYQNLVLREKCREVSEIIKGISMVEMHHLHMLGCAIVAIGGNPKYVNPNTRNWWNSSVVIYENELCDALLVDLRHETEAHQAYLAAASKVNNPALASLLRCIAADEKVHMELLTRMINCHCRNNECKEEARNECRNEPRSECREEPRNECRNDTCNECREEPRNECRAEPPRNECRVEPPRNERRVEPPRNERRVAQPRTECKAVPRNQCQRR